MEPTYLEQLKRLHKVAFGDPDSYIDYFFQNRYREELSEVYLDGDKVLSTVYARIFRFSLFGKRIDLPFLTGVATLPEARGKGLATLLLDRMAQKLENLGYPLVLLHPFNHDFYRARGFETVSMAGASTFTLPISENNREKTELSNKENGYSEKDLATLTALYSEYVFKRNFYRIREESEWKDITTEYLLDGSKGSLFTENGIPKGYIFEFPDVPPEVVILPENGKKNPVVFPDAGRTDGREWTMGKLLNFKKFLTLIPAKNFPDTTAEIEGKTYRIFAKVGYLCAEPTVSNPEYRFTSRELLSAIVFAKPPFSEIPPFPLTMPDTY